MILTHKASIALNESKLFQNISCYTDLVNAIQAYAGKDVGSKQYRRRLGEAFECYCEFLCKQFDKQLDIFNIKDTSQNEYEAGIDFRAENYNKEPEVIQCKFRNNPNPEFTRDDMGSFVSVADENNIPKERRMLITNSPDNDIFHFSYPGKKQMRVISRKEQEDIIDRCGGGSKFYKEFCSVISKCVRQTNIKPLDNLWPHQEEMVTSAFKVINGELPRGRVICATGGGKTRVSSECLQRGLNKGFQVQSFIAPKIELLRQTADEFFKFGLFNDPNIIIIHFRTGDEPKLNKTNDLRDRYVQTTDSETFSKILLNAKKDSKRVIIMTTFASEKKMSAVFKDEKLKKADVSLDLTIWDEFQHCVKQDVEQEKYLENHPSKRHLFFSASQKHGRVVSAYDEKLFGPELTNITFSRLASIGILTPKIRLVIIKRDDVKVQSVISLVLHNELKKWCEDRGDLDLDELLLEAAACLKVQQDLLAHEWYANCILYSRRVANCNAMKNSKTMKELAPNMNIDEIVSSTPRHEREGAKERIAVSKNSLMLNHSIAKEGFDNPLTNAVILSRNMDVIGIQQALGRAARILPEDREKLLAGQISLDSPKGWKKYYANVYVISHDETFELFVKDIIEKLASTGLTSDDVFYDELTESRHGNDEEQPEWLPECKMPVGLDPLADIAKMSIKVEEKGLMTAYVEQVFKEYQEQERLEKRREELKKMSRQELMKEHKSNPDDKLVMQALDNINPGR
jgi:predicted helicase